MWVLEISNLPLNIPQNGEFSAQNLALLGENFLTIFQQPRIFFFWGGGRKSHPPATRPLLISTMITITLLKVGQAPTRRIQDI